MAETTSTPPAELSPLQLAAWRGFLRAHAALVKQLDAQLEAEHGLPLSHYEVLITLQAAPDQRLRMAELADRALLSRSGMTRLVDRLEREGLLRRISCPSDARGCFAALAPAGEELLRVARPTHLDGVRELFLGRLDERDLHDLERIWGRLLASDGGHKT